MKTLNEGQFKEYSRIVVETDEKNPKAIFTITSEGIITAEGYKTKIISSSNVGNKEIPFQKSSIQNHALDSVIEMIIEKEDSNNTIVALILADEIEFSEGYQLRMQPIYD